MGGSISDGARCCAGWSTWGGGENPILGSRIWNDWAVSRTSRRYVSQPYAAFLIFARIMHKPPGCEGGYFGIVPPALPTFLTQKPGRDRASWSVCVPRPSQRKQCVARRWSISKLDIGIIIPHVRPRRRPHSGEASYSPGPVPKLEHFLVDNAPAFPCPQYISIIDLCYLIAAEELPGLGTPFSPLSIVKNVTGARGRAE